MHPSIKTLLLLTSAFFFLAFAPGDQFIESASRIIFFGDSITQQGVQPGGYVSLLRDSLVKKYPEIEIIGAGISGNKVADLQKRLERDVLDIKPTAVVIYIGINDVWHWVLKNNRGTEKDAFRSGLTAIIAEIQKQKSRVVLCTPTVIGELKNGANPQDAMLDEYSAISRAVAKKTGARLCDLRKIFVDYIAANNPLNAEKGILTTDRVHLNSAGNTVVAEAMMETLKH